MGQAIERQSLSAGSPGGCSGHTKQGSVHCPRMEGGISTNKQLYITGHNSRPQMKPEFKFCLSHVLWAGLFNLGSVFSSGKWE